MSVRTVDQLMQKGKLPYFRLGRTTRFRLASVIAYLQQNRYQAPQVSRTPFPLQANMELIPIRETLLDIETILSCAAAQLTNEPMEIAAARQSIEEARTMLLDLAEAVEKVVCVKFSKMVGVVMAPIDFFS